MTHLGRFFQEQQEAQKITAKDLAARMHMDPTLISRAKQGERRAFAPDSIVRMIAGISDDPEVKLKFVRAVMLDFRDQCVGIRRDAIDVVISDRLKSRTNEDAPIYRPNASGRLLQAITAGALSQSDIDALSVLAANFRKNHALRRAILALAEMARNAQDQKA